MRVSGGEVSLSNVIVDSDLDMDGTYQVKDLASPASGEALRKGEKDIANAEVSDSAAIVYSKLSLATSVAIGDLTLASGKVARGTGSGATAVDKTESKLLDCTRDMTAASGDVSYTSTGFTPTSVISYGAVGESNTVNLGVSDSSADEAALRYYPQSSNWEMTTTQFIGAYESASKIQAGVVKSLDADGVTLTWTKYGTTSAGTFTFKLLCQA